MLQSWAVKAPSEHGESALSEILEMPDKAFSQGLGKLYTFGGGMEPPSTFRQTLKLYMENENISVEELAYVSGISERTIGKMRNQVGYKPMLNNVIAICIGLHLNPSYSYRLIELAGYRLTESDQDVAYRLLIDKAQEVSIEDCNRFLKRANLKPL